MAYVSNNEKKQNPNNPDDQSIVNPASGVVGGGTPGGASAPAKAQAQGQQAPQKTFAGITDYLNANRDKTAGLATQVGGLVTDYGNQARQDVNKAETSFNKDVDQNTVRVDEDVFNKAQTDPASLTRGFKGADIGALAQTFPTQNDSPFTKRYAVAPNPNVGLQRDRLFNVNATPLGRADDLTTFAKMRDAEYKGPTALEETPYYQPAADSVNKATTAAENARTEQGNKTLLEDLHKQKTGTINKGALLLDQGLIRSDQGSRDILGKAADKNSDIGGLFENTSSKAQARAGEGAAITDRTRNSISNTFGGVQAGIENDLNKKAEDAIQESKDQTQTIINMINSGGSPTDEQLKTLGIDRQQWNKLHDDVLLYNQTYGEGTLPEYQQEIYQETPENYELDLNKYLTQQNPELNINAQNIASQEDYDRYGAMNTLLGTNNTFLSDPSQAGKANTDAIDLNIGSAQEDLNKKKKNIEDNRAARREYYYQALRSAQR